MNNISEMIVRNGAHDGPVINQFLTDCLNS